MSPRNNREEWSWFSLFDPKTGHSIPAIEAGFEDADQANEVYIELNDEEEEEVEDDEEEDIDNTEEGNTLSIFDDVDEDEE